MPRSPISSAQTRAVLRELADNAPAWQHGYDLAKATGLKSGTLYPMLARLADHGFLETAWEEGEPAGRPRRHLYRLTARGADAAAALAAVAESASEDALASAPPPAVEAAPIARAPAAAPRAQLRLGAGHAS